MQFLCPVKNEISISVTVYPIIEAAPKETTDEETTDGLTRTTFPGKTQT